VSRFIHNDHRIAIMRMKLSYLTPLLAAGAAAVAIAAAPTAMAADAGPGCDMQGSVPVCPNTHSTVIDAPAGNSQINPSPGDVGYSQPQYPHVYTKMGPTHGV
jgi:hypothetical protein